MKNRKGLTLIEMIVSIAIISILAVVILSLFSTNIKNIIRAGKRTEKVYEIKEEIDQKIIKNEGDDSSVDVSIPGVGIRKINGKIIKSNDSDIEITTFVPIINTP